MAEHSQPSEAHTRPPDDALQTSLLAACDPDAAASSSRWSLLRRALDQGLQVCTSAAAKLLTMLTLSKLTLSKLHLVRPGPAKDLPG